MGTFQLAFFSIKLTAQAAPCKVQWRWKTRLLPGQKDTSSYTRPLTSKGTTLLLFEQLSWTLFKSIWCLLLSEIGCKTTVHQRSGLTAIATWLVPTAESQAQHRSKERLKEQFPMQFSHSLQCWQSARMSFGSVSRENLIWESWREASKIYGVPQVIYFS